MLNTLEDKTMVKPINDVARLKPIDSDSRLKNKEQNNKLSHTDPSADSVSFSATSKQLEALKASLRDIPEINEARVLYFKSEIQQGNYQIDSNNIARKLLNTTETA